MEKTFEGQTWILKSRVEEIVKERVSKVANRANTAQEQITQLQEQLESAQKAQGTVDILSQRIQELEGNLEKSNTRYSRYQAITKHGLHGEDMLEALEYSYERSQARLPKKDQTDLATWLDNMVQNPEQAPVLIRPHLQNLQPQQAQQAQQEPLQEVSTQAQLQALQAQQSNQNQPAPTPPRVNMGVQRTPEPTDLLERALQDPEFYAANRDRVQQAWRTQATNIKS